MFKNIDSKKYSKVMSLLSQEYFKNLKIEKMDFCQVSCTSVTLDLKVPF